MKTMVDIKFDRRLLISSFIKLFNRNSFPTAGSTIDNIFIITNF